MQRQYFVTKIEMLTDDGEYVVTAKAKSTDPGKKARSTLQAFTRDPKQYTVGTEVRPVFVVD